MQTMFKDGTVMVCGRLPKDAELRTVGEKNSSLLSFGLAVGERDEDGTKTTVWANVQAWHERARKYAGLKKGDTVMVIGKLDVREYEGKTYKNLVADMIITEGALAAAVSAPAPAAAPDTDLGEDFEELFSDDGVPF